MTSAAQLQNIIDAFPSEAMIVDSNSTILLMSRSIRPHFEHLKLGKDSLYSLIEEQTDESVVSAIRSYFEDLHHEETDSYFKVKIALSQDVYQSYSLIVNPSTKIEDHPLNCFSVTFNKPGSENIITTAGSYLHSQYLEMIFENTSDAIFLSPISPEGIHGNFIEVNYEACVRLGYSKEELLTLSAKSINPSENASRIRAYGEMLLKNGFAIFEAIHIAKSGTHIPVEVHATIIKEGDHRFVLSVVKDIRILKESQEQQALFGRLMDYSWNEIYVINSENLAINMANEGALKNLGITKDELSKFKFTDILVDTKSEEFIEFSKILFSGEESQLIYESKLRRVNGSTYPVEMRLQLSQSEVPPLFFANVQDISQRKKIERRLTYLASYDSLTGLPNRTLYMDRLDVAMEACKRQENMIAVMFLDLDGFKQVNDMHGHDVGDKLVKEVAKRLIKSTRKSDTIARFGGDEFTIILNNIAHVSGVNVVIDKILSTVTQPFLCAGKEILTSPSIGVTLYPFKDSDDSKELLRQADIAMYHVKKTGKRGASFYSASMSTAEIRRNNIESSVVNALKRGELELYYQPRVDLSNASIIGAEVLLRWHSPSLGFVSPVEFIPVMEKVGIMNQVGEWVLKEACSQLREWMDQGSDIRLSVNVSAKQFSNGNLHEIVCNILKAVNVPENRLEIEITEGLLIEQSEDAAISLEYLSNKGVLISLDDFGTGYSSLSYLKQFPIDVLKIDRSFVMDLEQNKDSLVIVEAIIGLAKNLNLSVTAEGIEELWHANFLKEHGCDEGQGYYFAKPMPKDDMEKLLTEAKSKGLPI